MIKLKNITKVFKLKALDDISINLSNGEIIGLIGPNGAGKTTLMRIITGILKPTSGNILISDIDIEESDEFKEIIGYMPENSALYDDMTVQNYLTFIAQARKIKKQDIASAISKASKSAQISDRLGQKIATLSKGYKRRVSLAQAIVHDPKILILDEPTEGLDPNQKKEFYDLIAGFKKTKLVIISTHVLDEVKGCSRIVLINDGKIILDSPSSDIKIKENENLNDLFYALTKGSQK